ncbi:RNA-directed DNA polymerase, eukaryota, reverse transcriptase zinc-binding domain protein, partial [Tanacetum coccineum]
NIILFGDLNEVRCETKRFGSSFLNSDVVIFNSFIRDDGLIDLRGKMFTWMNKTRTKLKLDRFLVSDGVLHAHSHMQVTVLDRVWSDHNPILLHRKKSDFSLTPFKLFHSWFDRIGFDDVVKEAWNNFSFEVHGSIMTFHDKLRGLKTHLKLWYSHTKDSEHSRKQSILHSLRLLDEKIDACRANDEDRELRVNNLLELEVYPVGGSFVVLEYGRYGVSKVLDTAYRGFLGLGTTFDIFQNILFPYGLNTAYWSFLDTAYWILFPSWSLVSAGTDTPYLP